MPGIEVHVTVATSHEALTSVGGVKIAGAPEQLPTTVWLVPGLSVGGAGGFEHKPLDGSQVPAK